MTPKQPGSANITIDGAKLRHARHLARLGQTPLAKKADVSQSYVSALEDGTRCRVSPEVYGRLCDALGVTDPAALMPDTPVRTDP